MLRVAANYHNASFAFDDFAFFAHGFNGRSYFHLKLPPCHEALSTGKEPLPFSLVLFGTPGNAALLQVVWRHLHSNLISRKNSDEVHSQLSGDVSQNYVAIWQLNFELSVWQSFQYFAFNFDYVFLGQVKNLLLDFLGNQFPEIPNWSMLSELLGW